MVCNETAPFRNQVCVRGKEKKKWSRANSPIEFNLFSAGREAKKGLFLKKKVIVSPGKEMLSSQEYSINIIIKEMT